MVFSQIKDTLILICSNFALRHVPLRDSCTCAAKPVTTSNTAYPQQQEEDKLTCSSLVNKYDHEGATQTVVKMDLSNVVKMQNNSYHKILNTVQDHKMFNYITYLDGKTMKKSKLKVLKILNSGSSSRDGGVVI